MSRLEELEKELYGKGEEEELKKRLKRETPLPLGKGHLPSRWFGAKKPAAPAAPLRKTLAFKVFLGTLAVIVIVGVALFVFVFLGTKGSEAEVVIHGEEQFESGEVLSIPVSFKNKSGTPLREVELILLLPPDSILVRGGLEEPAPPRITKTLSDLDPEEEGVEAFSVRIFGREKEERAVEAKLLYRPENLEAKFSVSAVKKFVVGRVPLSVSWEIPELLSHGQGLEFTVRYGSLADTVFKNMALRIEYPPGFQFASAEPKPDFGDAIWKLGDLAPLGEGSIKIRGTVSGSQGEIQAFRGELGVLDEVTKDWRSYTDSSREIRIAASPLSVQAFWGGRREGVVAAGDRGEFKIVYKNNTAFAVKNVTVRAVPEGKIFLIQTLRVEEGGVFDSQSQSVVWGPANTPQLREIRAGESGELSFSLETRQTPPMQGEDDENQEVGVSASIGAASPPKELEGTDLASQDRISFKLQSKILFSGKTVRYSAPIPNTGPLPPRVGAKTTYNIIWEVRNFTNDLDEVEIKGLLPPNVAWENKISPTEAKISFDPASSEVRWRIGKLEAGTGVTTPALTAAFQVSIIPSEADLGKSPVILAGSEFYGKDAFTGEERRVSAGVLTIELREDALSKFQDWTVVR